MSRVERYTDASPSGGQLTSNIYGYEPNQSAAVIFLLMSSLLTAMHLPITIKSRIWPLLSLVLGGIGEMIGWSGRLAAAKDLYSLNAFITQEVALILAPNLFSMAIYSMTGLLIHALGAEHSRLSAKNFMIVFGLADLVAIAVQSAGVGVAINELEAGNNAATGSNVMVAGIVLQIVSMFVYVYLAGDFFRKAHHDPKYESREEAAHGNFGLLAFGLLFASFFILLRCFFRAIELAGGFDGFLFTHERYFFALEATPIVLVQLVFVFAHPMWTLPDHGIFEDEDDISFDEDLPEGRQRTMSFNRELSIDNEKPMPRRRPRREW